MNPSSPKARWSSMLPLFVFARLRTCALLMLWCWFACAFDLRNLDFVKKLYLCG